MKVLVVSDTHGKSTVLEQVMEMERPFDILIHCGDVEGEEDYIRALAGVPAYMVAGNNDFFSDLDKEMVIELGGVRIMITHGHYYGVSLDLNELIDEAASREIPLVLFGHTHKPVISTKRGVTAVNPGSLSYPRQEGRIPSYLVLNIHGGGKFDGEIRYI